MSGTLVLTATGGHYRAPVRPTITVSGGSALTTLYLNIATSATFTVSGGTAPYQFGTAGNLPPGLSISGIGGILAGAPTQLGTFNFAILAIDANGNVGSIAITSTVGAIAHDAYFPYTTLIVNGDTIAYPTYTTDSSANNYQLSVTGGAYANKFNPLQGSGYYSNYLPGNTGYLTAPANTAYDITGGNFTVEAWVNFMSWNTMSSSGMSLIGNFTSSNGWIFGWGGGVGANCTLNTYNSGSGVTITTTGMVAGTNIQLGNWYHVAMMQSGGTIYFFLNGVMTYSTTAPVAVGAGNTLAIGVYLQNLTYAGNPYWNISNLRIVKGSAVYPTSGFTPSTTPLTAVSGTSLLTCVNNNFSDNSTYNATITVNGSPQIVSAQPFGSLPTAVQSYGSGYFDGSSGYLTAPSNSAYALGSGAYTVEAWIYLTSASTTYGYGVMGTYPGSGPSGWSLTINRSSGGYGIYWITAGSATATYGTLFTINTWYHVAIVRTSTSSNGLTFYVNGVSVATGTDSVNDTYSSTFYIGNQGPATQYFPGYISNARVVKGTAVYTTNFTPSTTALTAVANTQLLSLQYKQSSNNNSFYDDSQNNYPITRVGTATQGTFTPFTNTGWSYYFGGNGNNIYSSNANFNVSSATLQWSIEMWVWPVVSGGYFFAIGSGGAYGNSMFCGWNSNAFSFGQGNGGGSNPTALASAASYPLGSWYHYAVTKDSSQTIRLFVNGQLAASTTGNYGVAGGTTAVFNGVYDNGGLGNTGGTYYVANFRFVNGQAVYTTTFTPPTSLLTTSGISGTTVMITGQTNRFADVVGGNTFGFNGTPSVVPYSQFAPSVAPYSTSTVGGSIYLNGSTDYISYPNVPGTQLGSSSWTMEAWFYQTAYTGNGNHIFWWNGNSGSSSYAAVRLQTNGNNSTLSLLGSSTGSSWQVNFTTTATFQSNAWNHTAVTYNGTTMTLYLNGANVGSGTVAGPLYAGTLNYVGQMLYSSGTWLFAGYIHGFRIAMGQLLYTGSSYTVPTAPPTAITGTAALLTATNGGVVDQTGRNEIVTVGALPQANTFKYGNGAIYFNGSSRLVIPSNNLFAIGTSYTIEMWQYRQSNSSSGSYTAALILIGSQNYGVAVTGFFLTYSTSGVLNFYDSNNATVISYASATTNIPLNTWTHLAIVRNGSGSNNVTLYVNGVSVATGTSSGTQATAQSLFIGGDTAGNGGFTGYIDDLRITNGVARYTTNFIPPASAAITQ